MGYLSVVFYSILILFSIGFAVLNAHAVEVNFYFKTIHIAVPILVVLLFGLGTLFGYLLSLSRYIKLNLKNRSLKHQLDISEKEIKNLRAIPLHDQT